MSVAWLNGRGEQSKTHYTKNLDKAVCGQFLGENFRVVPHAFGLRCVPCTKWLTAPDEFCPCGNQQMYSGGFCYNHFQDSIRDGRAITLQRIKHGVAF